MARADDTSFEALALPHLESLYRIARRLTQNEHEAEDLVQETYLKAYRAFASYEARAFGIKPWLLRILHNTFLNRLSREKRAPRAVDQQLLDQSSSNSASLVPPELDYEDLDEEVVRALDRLPPEFRAVLLLWATMELSYQEIADVLEVPIGTVMSRLHRARRLMIGALQAYARQRRLLRLQERP